jgi:hypothetical protein
VKEHNLDDRAITEDGSRIVFISAEPLSAAAGNGVANAYEWHEENASGGGSVSLVSTGSSDAPVGQAIISATGRDIFFTTTQGLVSQDTDGQQDIYDARLGGGFPEPPSLPQPCSGDACQGPLTNPAPLLVPGSISQAPGANVPPSAVAPPTVPHKPGVKCAKGKGSSRGRCVKRKSKRRKPKAHKSSHVDRRAE